MTFDKACYWVALGVLAFFLQQLHDTEYEPDGQPSSPILSGGRAPLGPRYPLRRNGKFDGRPQFLPLCPQSSDGSVLPGPVSFDPSGSGAS